jgi:peptide methionine sulfoxide reductase MsrB
LLHWDKSNFEPTRDASARVVYEPKDGTSFFQNHLSREEFEVMRGVSVEQPFFSKYNRFLPKKGHFCCKACGNALYSHKAKFNTSDGWPAFGAYVDGAIEMITAEERNAQLDKEENQSNAAIRMQAFVRGSLDRTKVNNMLAKLIEELLAQQASQQETPSVDPEDPWDEVQSLKPSNEEKSQKVDKPIEIQAESSASPNSAIVESRKAKFKQTNTQTVREVFNEVHCHRCKSHLGNVVAEDNRGSDGQMFRERHRVNGRALKYVEDNLPKRIMAGASMLFSNQSQIRLRGRTTPKPVEAELPFNIRRTAFVSPRSNRPKLALGSKSFTSPIQEGRPKLGSRPMSFRKSNESRPPAPGHSTPYKSPKGAQPKGGEYSVSFRSPQMKDSRPKAPGCSVSCTKSVALEKLLLSRPFS